MDRMIVLKFGGSSVSTRESWSTIARITKDRIEEGYRPLLVCSALRSVSNDLERLLEAAKDGAHAPILQSLISRHLALGEELGVDAVPLLKVEFDELERIALGVSLIGDISPKVKAQAISKGETMSTKLGAHWLESQGIATTWLDARALLLADGAVWDNEGRHFLQATCSHGPAPEVRESVALAPGKALITQGFVATDEQGETVLLGRGGSDTSAALLASKIGAERLEIWTDVPGAFTANPREVPAARLLLRLGYEEAQELASSGAGVLHPRCIEPLRRQSIPLHIRDTNHPDRQGTIVSTAATEREPTVKAVAMRKGLTVISMDSLGMWQQVGFLADAFSLFQTHGISVEQIATSEANVTVSFDPTLNEVSPLAMESLVSELSQICEVEVITGCVAINVVGRNVRKKLHELGPAFALFEEKPLYLLSQAATDLNLTFLTEERRASRIMSRLHELIFDGQEESGLFGPTWLELHDEAPVKSPRPAPWWTERPQELAALAKDAASPLFLYDEGTLRGAAAKMKGLPLDGLFYAMKANSNPEVLRVLEEEGVGFECVSPGEIELVERLFPSLDRGRILFTPNFAPKAEYRAALERGIHVTLDNVYPLRAWPEVFAGKKILVRIDPGKGAGHHDHVKTAGSLSKFGIPVEELPELAGLVREHDVEVVGLHAHVGSGVLDPSTWAENARFLAAQAKEHFPEVRLLNLGGGLGVAEAPSQSPLDLDEVARRLEAFREEHPTFELWMEPGRFLVAEAGVLLARVTQLKQKGGRGYVGVDTGMNSLLRPALYGSFHEIVNLSRWGQPPRMVADVVGPICESGDVLGHGRRLPITEEGDVLLIATAGAYGRSMGSDYNLREPADERLLAVYKSQAEVG